MNRIAQIKQFGQSVWLDHLSRALLQSEPRKKQLFEEDGIVGITSNPAIFYQSIQSDALYQKDLQALKQKSLSAEARYEQLVIPDIQAACDLLKTVYTQSNHLDGYVSLEVNPHLANNCQATIDHADRLWHAIHRPNAMIKVPATAAGLIAFEELIARGINVNITLMFSLKHVDDVLNAYIRGLEARLRAHQSITSLFAVASIFLSRVDTVIDQKLEALGPKHASLMGKAAIAFAKTAYQHAKQLFESPRFKTLSAKGGHPQRLLWASTGTKNPHYKDTLYVEELIGPHTVNTVPSGTLDKFRDHGKAQSTLETGLDAAEEVLSQLCLLGPDFNLNLIGEQLQIDGLKLFCDAFDQLLVLTQ